MSKPIIGLVLGAFLGLLDGISSFFYPDVRAQMMLIITFSTIKGLITGLIAGIIARKWNSLPLGIATGLIVGLVLAYLAAPPPDSTGTSYYAEIMLPGSILGVIVGFATQRLGEIQNEILVSRKDAKTQRFNSPQRHKEH
ncbi:hypothetical protein L0244_00685 [bacterium]|nr:hypothetical protein [bacterium]